MRTALLLAFCMFNTLWLNAQKKFNDAVKINLSGLVVRNVSVQYERKIAKRLSVAVNYRNLPNGTIPFASFLNKQVTGTGIDFNNTNISTSAITPELRLYVGKRGALRGFYLAPFASFAKYTSDFPLTFADKTGIFNGNVKSTTGGLQLGTQMKLTRRFYLDWWIVGLNIGKGNGNLNLTTSLNAFEQSALRDKLENLKTNVPFSFIQSYTVDSNGANVVVDGPWLGLRGFGFNLSFMF